MTKNIIIGLTGPTGSGKSTICNSMVDQCIKIIDADKISRNIINENYDCKKELTSFFGKDILDKNLSINRKTLARNAFSSKEQTQVLNKITHPYIVREIKKVIDESRNFKTIIIDAALLFESGLNFICDSVVAVLCDFNIRKNRIIKRDDLSEYEAILRLHAQKCDLFYHKADFVIYNNKGRGKLLSDFKNIFRKIQENSNETST